MQRSVFGLISIFALVGCSDDQGFSQVTETPDAPEEVPPEEVEPHEEVTIPDGVATGGVQGRVCAPNQHTYIPDAKVSIEHQWGVTTTYTDSEGYFTLEPVPAGEAIGVIQKGSFMKTFNVLIPENEIVELAEEECFEDDLRIAVVTGEWDNIGAIVSSLGLSYDTYSGLSSDGANFLRDPSLMNEYDIIFLNCGISFDSMTPYMGEIGNNIEDFVYNGGSIYGSDWAHFLVEGAFPDMVNFRGDDTVSWEPLNGAAGTYTVNVIDSGMVAALGGATTASVRYDYDAWATTMSSGTGTTTMVYGKYQYYSSELTSLKAGEGPLAIKLDAGTGRVIYTTFHNESQITLDMEALLREIIWAL